jgi:hypothetical protein
VAVVCCGCSSSIKQVGPRHASEWAYAPNSIKVHPLTRIRIPDATKTETDAEGPDKKEPIIVVHVEFLDGDGFSCRGVGELRVEVHAKKGGLLGEAVVDLRDPDVNRLRFDPVTRTYRIHFNKLPKGLREANIRAFYTVLGNKELKSKQFHVVNHEQ